ncbi:PRC-barrel domain-containing protein [Jiella avicenniae]|uniref:PRC-barrel domain-containing protein n=1 Tax=Jiella avicenniae TaxID=2907202 RepID=A0A9X1P4P8_9HYPH|nr:PRC-barrel domain-containing protein [Jiella avicenniae]MCE7030413.1 PRC-barrel domain-containing protein [Jiella avicenniae]
MRKSIFISLLAGVALPLSAYAQDSGTTPPAGGETTPPAASDGTSPQSSDTAPASDSGAGTAGGSDAGTMSDTPDSGASSDSTGSSGAADGSGGMAPADGAAAPADGAAAPADNASSDSAAPADGAATDGAASSDSAMADSGPFVTVPPSGAWRATDLDGKDVYDTQGESIGEITDVLVSEDGKVIAVLVGVGGFLGIGEKDVAVSMSALEFGPGKTEGLKTEEEANAEASAASGTAGGTGMAGGTAGGTGMAGGTAGGGAAPAPAASAEPEEPVVGEDNLPDRIVLNVSREQLENAPAYGEPEGEDDAADDAAPTDPAAGEASQPAAGGTAPAN